ncbi:MAG: endolytic transglycosylase MltG [Bacteroidales bacterium]|nr:endolytic transglycosylase MltG [Bacteroidales bacterium]
MNINKDRVKEIYQKFISWIKKRSISVKKALFIFGGVAVLAVLGAMLSAWFIIYKNNVKSNTEQVITIPKEASVSEIIDTLKTRDILKSYSTFNIVSNLKSYPDLIKPGKYIIKPGMSNNRIVNMLRIGDQVTVKLVFNNIRSVEQLAGVIGNQIASDSLEVLKALNNDSLMLSIDADTMNVLGIMIPNTYEVYWDLTANGFVKRMGKEYKRFWNKKRLKKAKKAGLTPREVSILASIVQEETTYYKEMPKVAGVYINRLKRGIRLQADPTVKYAVGDFTIKRVLNKHLAHDSPYNTYKYKGLPPTVISMPTIQAIEAVLDYEKHKYMYFCAKDDFSGRHAFAKTLKEHNRNAARYRRALNKRRIYK